MNNTNFQKQMEEGHTITEYVDRIVKSRSCEELESKERQAYYTALFHLNHEMEEEIASRLEELSLLRQVKAVIDRGLLASGKAILQLNEIDPELKNGGENMQRVEIEMDTQLAEKLERMARKENKSVSGFLSELLIKQMKKDERFKDI